MLLLCVVLALCSAVSGLTCSCNGYFKKQQSTEDTMGWFNELFSAWYEAEEQELFTILQSLIQENVNTLLPSWIGEGKLKRLGSKSLPEIKQIRSHSDTVHCQEGVVLTRTTLDMSVVYQSDESVADVDLWLLMGTMGVSIDRVLVEGVVRVELLMNSQMGILGMESVAVTLLGRPQVEFAVQLFNAIGSDTFGLHGIIENAVESIVQEKLVYPGMFYVNLAPKSTSTMSTSLIANDPLLHPAVISVEITIVPRNVTIGKEFRATFQYNGGERQEMDMGNEGRHRFDAFYNTFEYPEIEVYLTMSWLAGEVARATVDVQRLLRSDDSVESHAFLHKEGDKARWDIQIEVKAYLLPVVPVVQKGGSVAELSTVVHEAQCTPSTGKGVLYIHIHSATNLTIQDTLTSDPYVYIYLNSGRVSHTPTIGANLSPVWNHKIEMLLNSDTPLEEQNVRFEMFDADTWNKDDAMGSVSLALPKKELINIPLTLTGISKEMGTLFVSIIFRPVPFL